MRIRRHLNRYPEINLRQYFEIIVWNNVPWFNMFLSMLKMCLYDRSHGCPSSAGNGGFVSYQMCDVQKSALFSYDDCLPGPRL